MTTQTPRRIPGAPPIIFLEGALALDPPSPITKPTEPSSSTSGTKIKITEEKRPSLPTTNPYASSSSPYSYGSDDIPVFGRPFGMPTQQRGESSATGALMSLSAPQAQDPPRRKKHSKSLNPYEDLLMEVDADLDRYVEGGGGGVEKPSASFMIPTPSIYTPTGTSPAAGTPTQTHTPNTRSSFRTKLTDYFRRPNRTHQDATQDPSADNDSPPPQFITTAPPPTECSVCMEEFTEKRKPPAWVTLTCVHQPSVCTTCLAQSIRTDIESKIWNNVRCPEEGCDAVLIYEDVKRLADAVTFARYEILSFRSAVSTDPNFVWCQKCNFGQLHSSGAASPIVTCLNCNHRTCFNHQVPWHARMSCAEYDLMVADPDNYEPPERDGEESEETEEAKEKEKEREEAHRERLAEQERQRQQHAELRRKARESQREEGRKKREAWEQGELKRRLKEEKASLAKVEGTTKRCPGCKWPIEKNHGCAHMTCIKCKAEFCWDCLADYKEIRTHGNGAHARTCQWHTDNLHAS